MRPVIKMVLAGLIAVFVGGGLLADREAGQAETRQVNARYVPDMSANND